jgi:hypothetical protein
MSASISWSSLVNKLIQAFTFMAKEVEEIEDI